MAVVIEDGDDLERGSESQELEFMADVADEDPLSEIIERGDDLLEGKVGAAGEMVWAMAEEDWWADGFLDFLECVFDGPSVSGIESCEVDEDDGPPFFGIEEAREMGVKTFKERDLPIEVMRELEEGGGDSLVAVGEAKELVEEEVT
jgi:hypothetical protein